MIDDLAIFILGTNITSPDDSAAIANSLGGFSNPTSYHNDSYDAFRHAYGSALLTEKFGDAFAKWSMDNHESENPNSAVEVNMDKYNNNIGRVEYNRWKDALGSGQTNDSLEKWIYNRVKEEKTINNPNDPNETRQWLESDSGLEPLTDLQKEVAKKIVNDLFNPPPLDNIEDVKQQVTSAKSTSSPIILDLNNNGVETTAVKQGAYFDHANDGFAEQTGWVGANDSSIYNKNYLRQYAT